VVIPVAFSTQLTPNLSMLDQDFTALGNASNIFCTAIGTNAITLTEATGFAAPSAYVSGQTFRFLAANTNTAVLSIQFKPSNGAGLGFFPAYLALAGALTQVPANGVVGGQYYEACFDQALNVGAGGFLIVPLDIGDQRGIEFIIDGGGSAITTGVKGYLQMPFNGVLSPSASAHVLADRSGSITVDIWKCTLAQFDAGSTHPVVGDSITAGAPITMTTATKASQSMATWIQAFAATDVIAYNVSSVATVQRVTVRHNVLRF